MAKPRTTPSRSRSGSPRGTATSPASEASPDRAAVRTGPGPAGAEPPAPTSFDQIIGHARALEMLRQSVRAGRVHHCWVFSGPPGVGKRTTAEAFAAELLIPVSGAGALTSADPDVGSDRLRALLAARAHPDLHLISKELAGVSRDPRIRASKQTNIPKEVVREFLVEPAERSRSLRSGSDVGKVFIVDEADFLDAEAQNTLLKLLEEPPGGTVFILVTSEEHSMLPTVRSRSQRVVFATLSDAEMARWLVEMEQRGLPVPASDRAWLLRHAAGAPGAFVAAVQHNLIQWYRALEPILRAVAAGAPEGARLGPEMARLVGQRAEAEASESAVASKDVANRRWTRVMLRVLGQWTREGLAQAAAARDADALGRWARAVELIDLAERRLDANTAYNFVLENLGVQLMTPGPPVPSPLAI
jgi:DNA polymerase-3 subunit delta'